MPLIDLFPEYGVRELARLTGLSHGTISRVKRGLAADRQTMQTLYSVTGKCLCCDGIANLSPTVQPEPAPALEADIDDRLHNALMNYLHLHQAAYDVWRWFEVSRPDLIGPRAEALRDAVNGPRPYGSFAEAPTPGDKLADALALVGAAVSVWEGLVGEYGYRKAQVNFGALEDALAKLKGGA